MGTITERKRAKGNVVYKAEIVIKKNKIILHRESKTFNDRAVAKKWIKIREGQLEKDTVYDKKKTAYIKDLINTYIEMYHTEDTPFGRSKLYDLDRIKNSPIAKIDAYELTAKNVIDHCKKRREDVLPQTVQIDVVYLNTTLSTMKLPLDHQYTLIAIEDAKKSLIQTKTIAKSTLRDRRPTEDELKLLSSYFKNKQKTSQVPMLDIMWFAIHSSRRDSEITRIEWKDNKTKEHTGIVRDLKHPTKKKGNDKEFKYLEPAWEIVERQPKTSEFIFPHNPKTISNYFTKACKTLGIKDLRFHDLRHEATTRFFEMGYSIHQVPLLTLHESWTSLKRYTNVKAADLEDKTVTNTKNSP